VNSKPDWERADSFLLGWGWKVPQMESKPFFESDSRVFKSNQGKGEMEVK
jgi:hypothetical protein